MKWINRILTFVSLAMAIIISVGALYYVIIHAKAVEFNELQKEAIVTEVTEQEVQQNVQKKQIAESEETVETVTEEIVAPETEPIIVETDPIIVETEYQEVRSELVEFEGRQYNITSISIVREPKVTESGYVEKITEVPHYIQHYYRDVRYGGHGSVATHGCGITCLAMAYTYLLDEEITPAYMAEQFGRYNTEVGSDWGLFTASGEFFGLNVVKTHQWPEALEALENGHLVVAQANPDSIFTDGGHFILLCGLTDEGKIIVKDPSIYNYSLESSYILKEGFENGFNHENVKYNCCPFWILRLKDLEAISSSK